MNMEKIETRVADAILENESEVTVCGRKFTVTSPTPATLIMVSECVAELPYMNEDNAFAEVLVKAQDAKLIGRITAILILGAKRIKQNKTIRTGLFCKKREIDWLSAKLLEELTIKELASVLTQRLMCMQIADFFGITTSLSAANLIKATKEVETQSGEQ